MARTCERCGKSYEPKRPMQPSRFCGKDCQRNDARRSWAPAGLTDVLGDRRTDTPSDRKPHA